MKALFVGLGSIGTRHLKNLRAECASRGLPLTVHALRHSTAPLNEELAPLVDEAFQVLPLGETYDVAFITNPTNLHADTLALLRGRVDTLFIEKPLFESTKHNAEALGLDEEQKAYVAAPMRWCGVYMALKEHMEGVQPYSVRAICSSYLPDWRPAADYRTVYSAHADMGGGVSLDLIHEWDYLLDLFGLPSECINLRGHFSHLEIDSDDLSVYIARWPGFLGEVHLDYFGRTYRRDVEIFTKDGTMKADFGTGQLLLPSGEVLDYAEPPNRRYEREMAHFVAYALGELRFSANEAHKAFHTLQVALAANGK